MSDTKFVDHDDDDVFDPAHVLQIFPPVRRDRVLLMKSMFVVWLPPELLSIVLDYAMPYSAPPKNPLLPLSNYTPLLSSQYVTYNSVHQRVYGITIDEELQTAVITDRKAVHSDRGKLWSRYTQKFDFFRVWISPSIRSCCDCPYIKFPDIPIKQYHSCLPSVPGSAVLFELGNGKFVAVQNAVYEFSLMPGDTVVQFFSVDDQWPAGSNTRSWVEGKTHSYVAGRAYPNSVLGPPFSSRSRWPSRCVVDEDLPVPMQAACQTPVHPDSCDTPHYRLLYYRKGDISLPFDR